MYKIVHSRFTKNVQKTCALKYSIQGKNKRSGDRSPSAVSRAEATLQGLRNKVLRG